MSMARLLLTDEEWNLIADVFPEPAETGRPRRDPRTVLNGILWVLRTGSPWRDVPEEFGSWKTCWRMFDQWNADGTLVDILHRLQAAFATAGAIDKQLWCIDGTTVRAARCAAGGGKKGIQRSLATTH
jgi:transposase